MGIIVFYLDLKKVYGIAATLEGERLIGVNRNLAHAKSQLTIARGVGHLLLHKPGVWIIGEKSLHSTEERHAKQFAVCLCMEECYTKKALMEHMA